MNTNIPKVVTALLFPSSIGLKWKQECREGMWNRPLCLAVSSIRAQGMENAVDKIPKCYQ